MKKALLALPLALSLTACGSDIGTVQDNIMKFDQEVTVGEALNRWKSCDDTDWDTFKNDNDVTVVQFSCSHSVSGFMQKTKSFLAPEAQKEASYLDIESSVQFFQFTINQDESIKIDKVDVETIWADGKKLTVSQKPSYQLKKAYKNEVNYDFDKLNKSSAPMIAYNFQLEKAKAK